MTNNLKPGDPLLFVGADRRDKETSEHWDLRRAEEIDIDRESKLTKITLESGLGAAFTPPGTDIELFALRRRAALFGFNAPQFKAMPKEIREGELGFPEGKEASKWANFSITAIAGSEDDTIYLDSTYPEILRDSWVVLEIPSEVELYQVGQVDESSREGFTLTSKSTKLKLKGERLSEFDLKVRETSVLAVSEQLSIAERPLRVNDDDAVLRPVEGKQIVLDQLLGGTGQAVDALRVRALQEFDLTTTPAIPPIKAGDELEVIEVPTDESLLWTLRTVDGIEGTAASDAPLRVFPAHEFVTGLRADKSLIVSGKPIRATPLDSAAGLILIGDGGAKRSIETGEELVVLVQPRQGESSDELEFRLRTDDGFEGNLKTAAANLSYLPAREDDEPLAEHAVISTARPEFSKTAIILSTALKHIYDRTTVTIQANVARATHGESKNGEVLGSGAGSETFRKFTLAHKPLTHIKATTPSGTATTLKVRVDRVLWDEVAHFFDSGPNDRVFTSRLADDGAVTVQFGDGKTGSRLPTGVENVTADYRIGIGLPGLLKPDQLKLLMTQALGVKGVTNPLAPGGAEDPDSLDDARELAPLTVLTLDRVVSLQDYEDFARGFTGISKALAAELWQGEQRLVHLTVAGIAGGAPPVESLLAAIDAQRHVKARVIIQSYQAISFGVKARVLTDPAHIADDVLSAVEAHLLEAFAFGQRRFGQGATSSEVIAAIQEVEGVVAVDLELLNDLDPFSAPNVAADIANWQSGSEPPLLVPAQLLTIDPDDVRILELK